MKIIVVVIPKINYYHIITEEEFFDNNEFRTQNFIIEVLKLFLEREEFICDLIYLHNKGE